MQLSVIIVSYNTQKLTLNCLHSIFAGFPKTPAPFSLEVIVVDNASADGTVEAIKQTYPQVKVIEQQENLGFARGNNRGVEAAGGDYLLLLNSDTEILGDSLHRLLTEAINHHAEIATCRLVNPDGSLQPQGGALPNLVNLPLWMLNLDHLPLVHTLFPPYQERQPKFFNRNQPLGWAGGTALLVKREVYRSLGGLDDQIFMYAEDVDFCYRAHQRGFPIRYFSEPTIKHLRQGSGVGGGAILGEYQGLIYFYKKNHPGSQVNTVKFWLKAGAWLRMVIFGMIGQHELETVYRRAFEMA